MGILANENAISSGNYIIQNSLRFQSASSQYLNRTFASSPTTRTKITISVWVKRGQLGTNQMIIDGYDGTSALRTSLFFTTSDTLEFDFGGASAFNIVTTQVFRDPSAWYHIVLQVDSTQATAANRCILYVNGSQVTSYSTANYPAQNATHQFLYGNALNWIGTLTGSTYLFDGYLAEMNVIDGQALTPSSFGSTDPTSGQWVAAKYTGTYGTNGFYLPFSNGTSTTTLGADSSGNGNNWTLTNFTRSAGVSDCWMKDVPSGNGGASGTQPNSNYAVINPLWKDGTVSITKGNLNVSSGNYGGFSTLTIPTNGQYYAEFTVTTTEGNQGVGILKASNAYSGVISQTDMFGSNAVTYYCVNGNKFVLGGGSTAYGSSWGTVGDVIGIAVDTVNNQITFYKNNVSQGVITGLTSGIEWVFGTGNQTSSGGGSWNFGQRSFSYTPPSGFKALCTANLPVATIKQGNKYMDATLFTGVGTGASVVNAAPFQPDFVWIKNRSNAANHAWFDTVRGGSKYLSSSLTNAEATDPQYITSFNSNGFTYGNALVTTGNTYVGWQWQAGAGSTSSNTSGSITSTVSVNATAGFSIVTYTGTGANATVGHGLGVAPKMIICKCRGAASQWGVYHAYTDATPQNYALLLNSTAAKELNSLYWNNTAPTSTVFSLGGSSAGNTSGQTQVAYCFAAIPSFSKDFSYTGNGSADGVFTYLGFTPKLILLKRTDTTGNWIMWDTVRNTYNVLGAELYPNLSNAEATATDLDVLSNGFKIRNTTAAFNASGGTYVGFAWASNPFQNSNAY